MEKEVVALINYAGVREKSAEVFVDLMKSESTHLTSKKFDLSVERVRQIKEDVTNVLLYSFVNLVEKYKALDVLYQQCDGRNKLYRDVIKNKLSQMLEDEVERIIQKQDVLNLPINSLDVSQRILNCLKSADINTIFDLMAYPRNDLFKLRNFGNTSMRELENELKDRFGIKLKSKQEV